MPDTTRDAFDPTDQSPLARQVREWAASAMDASADRLQEVVDAERVHAGELRAINDSTIARDPEPGEDIDANYFIRGYANWPQGGRGAL